jgi:hypothetical protein
MKIIFEDGSSEECSLSDERQLSASEIRVHPDNRSVPKHLKRVGNDPPTYTQLATVRCAFIVPDHWVMTTNGLKRVVKVER